MSDRNTSQSKPSKNSDLDSLGQKVRDAQKKYKPVEDEANTARKSGWAQGVRYASDFSAAILVGTLLGFGLDKLFGTFPWGMLIGMILGFASGVRLIVLQAQNTNAEQDMAGTPPHDGS